MATKLTKNQKTKYIVGIIVCSALAILSFCGRYFNSALKYVAGIFLSGFGMSFYGILFGIIAACSFSLSGKKVRIPGKYVANFILLFVAVVFFVHSITSRIYLQGATQEIIPYQDYVGYLFNYYDFISFGGVVFGSIVYVMERVLTFWGALVIFLGFLVWTVIVAGDFFYCYFTGKITLLQEVDSTTQTPEPTPASPTQVVDDAEMRRTQAWATIMGGGTTEQPVEMPTPTVQVPPQDTFTFAPQTIIDTPQPAQPTVQTAEQILFQQTPIVSPGNSFFSNPQPVEPVDDTPIVRAQPTQAPVDDPATSWKILTTPAPQPEPQPYVAPQPQPAPYVAPQPVETPVVVQQTPVYEQPTVVQPQPAPYVAPQPVVIEQPVVQPAPVVEQPKPQPQPYVAPQPQPAPYVAPQPEPQPYVDPQPQVDMIDIVVDDQLGVDDDITLDEPFVEPEPIVKTPAPAPVQPKPTPARPAPQPAPAPVQDPDEVLAFEGETPLGNGAVQKRFDFATVGEVEKAKQTVHQYKQYIAPPTDLLKFAAPVQDTGAMERHQIAAQAIVRKLAVFGIKVEPVNIVVGPSVTQYRFKVTSEKTRMGDFAAYADDLKACLEATEDILIHAPIQGTNLVGIEVANQKKTPVLLRSLLESNEFQNATGKLVFAIGKDLIGNVILGDLSKMPHLLVAGTTGSGKSVALNCLIVSLMYKYGPEYLRFLMVDPKYVELSRYNGIPHMLTRETIVNIHDALAGMDYLVKEMDARYQLFKQIGADNIETYNKMINPKLVQRMPYLIYVVDELADLMATNKKAFEEGLGRLAAKARASGIHIVLATQRPDVNVITGTIKNNLSCRMALKVPAPQDSKTIINGAGADKLLGNGDMLYIGPGASSPARIQGAYVSNDEIKSLVEFLRDSNELYYDDSISNEIFVSNKPAEPDEIPELDKNDIPFQDQPENRIYMKKALRYWLTEKKGLASISSLQRGIRVGFNKAGTIKDLCEKMGYIEKLSDAESGNRAVRVLVTLEQLDELFPDVSDDDMNKI